MFSETLTCKRPTFVSSHVVNAVGVNLFVLAHFARSGREQGIDEQR